VRTIDGKTLDIDNPAQWPPTPKIEFVEEPYVAATVITPKDFVGTCMELCNDRRGIFKHMEYAGTERVILSYDLPLGEILLDFFDNLKSRTKGYASFDYELCGYKQSPLVKMDILINGDSVDALSFITHRERAYSRGKQLVERLKEILPRQMFEIRIQAALGAKVVAAESVRPMRKDVLAKCYGGDISRKRKLLEKQKEGKKRMKSVGRIEIPQEAFLSVLRVSD
jgi:GTP-binding protein LepA